MQEGRQIFVDTYGEDAQLGFFSAYKYKSTDEYDKEIEKKKAEIQKAEKEASDVRGEFDNYNAQLTN